MKDILLYSKLAELLKSGQPLALCTIVAARGSTPLKAGAKMIVLPDGSIFGTIGGGPLEHIAITDAVDLLKAGKSRLLTHDLKSELGMCCGGSVDLFIEPLMPEKKLFVFGGGHVGKAVAAHASELDFEITVIDNRPEIFTDWNASGFVQVPGEFARTMPGLPFDDNTFIVIATMDHPSDREVLAFCLRKPHKYLGVIGSQNKSRQFREEFIRDGIATEEQMDGIDMPIGLAIGAVTADEIAISILAKIISVKNKQTE